MYLHLGQSVVVPYGDVIGIFDLDITSQSYITRAFLSRAEKKKRVVNVSDELPKSFVVAGSREKNKVYISQLSPATLLKRSENNSFE